MYNQLVDSETGAGVMPTEGMLLYFEWLADNNGAKSNVADETKFTATYITDPSVLQGLEVERLTEDETRVAMEYAGLIRTTNARK